MSFSDGNYLRWVFLLCSPSLYPLSQNVEVWHSSGFSDQCRPLHLNNSLQSEFFRCVYTEQQPCNCWVSTSLCSTSTHSNSCLTWEGFSSVLTPDDAPFSFTMKSSIRWLVEKWLMPKEWCSSGKAYSQTDNEAGYQKLVQPTRRVFGFDHGCSAHTKIQGDLCKLGYSFSFARLSWESLELVQNICKYEYFIELSSRYSWPFLTML